MARDLIRFSNDKKGFRALLTIEALVALWSLAATYYGLRSGRTRTAIYGLITVFAAFYILGRSARSYRDFLKKEKENAPKAGEDESK